MRPARHIRFEVKEEMEQFKKENPILTIWKVLKKTINYNTVDLLEFLGYKTTINLKKE